MNYILCRNRVRNFDYWKGVFDSRADAHREAGLKLLHLWYELDSPRNVFFLFEAEDIERARKFLDSDLTAAERQSGLIEGDFRFFSPSLSYGVLNEAESHAFAEATESVAARDAKELSSAPAMNSSTAPVQSAEPEKSAEPAKSPTPAQPAKEKEPATRSSAPPTMKGLERSKGKVAVEPFEGWQPVENWPPAEATAEATPHEPPTHRRFVRSKY